VFENQKIWSQTMKEIKDVELQQSLFEYYAKNMEAKNLSCMFFKYSAFSLSVTFEYENKTYQINFYSNNVYYWEVENIR
jgi:hypothetical protein